MSCPTSRLYLDSLGSELHLCPALLWRLEFSDLQVCCGKFSIGTHALSLEPLLISTTQRHTSTTSERKIFIKDGTPLPSQKVPSCVWPSGVIQSILMQRFSEKAGNRPGEGFEASAVSFPDPLC